MDDQRGPVMLRRKSQRGSVTNLHKTHKRALSSHAEPRESVIKEGWLLKYHRRSIFKISKRRYFVLTSSFLYYYSDNDGQVNVSSMPLQSIPTRVISAVERVGNTSKLKIHTPVSVLLVESSSFFEAQEWRDALLETMLSKYRVVVLPSRKSSVSERTSEKKSRMAPWNSFRTWKTRRSCPNLADWEMNTENSPAIAKKKNDDDDDTLSESMLRVSVDGEASSNTVCEQASSSERKIPSTSYSYMDFPGDDASLIEKLVFTTTQQINAFLMCCQYELPVNSYCLTHAIRSINVLIELAHVMGSLNPDSRDQIVFAVDVLTKEMNTLDELMKTATGLWPPKTVLKNIMESARIIIFAVTRLFKLIEPICVTEQLVSLVAKESNQTSSVDKWSIEDVTKWLNDLGFSWHTLTFSDNGIDGMKLLSLKINELNLLTRSRENAYVIYLGIEDLRAKSNIKEESVEDHRVFELLQKVSNQLESNMNFVEPLSIDPLIDALERSITRMRSIICGRKLGIDDDLMDALTCCVTSCNNLVTLIKRYKLPFTEMLDHLPSLLSRVVSACKTGCGAAFLSRDKDLLVHRLFAATEDMREVIMYSGLLGSGTSST